MNTLRTSARRALPSILVPSSRVAFLALFAGIAACAAPTEDTESTGSAYSTRAPVDSSIVSFKSVDANTAYALDSSGRLWRDTVSPASHTQVDANVSAFQPLPGDGFVYVLGTNGNLWLEPNSIANRNFVASGVTSFQAFGIGYVLRKDSSNNLWYQIGNYAPTQVDGKVASFKAISDSAIYVLGTDGKLWNENGTMHNRFMVDQNVAQYFPADATHVYVEGTDTKLWNENGTAGNRFQVDANVASFYPANDRTVYVLGSDGNLWREVQTSTFRDHVDGNVKAFEPASGTAAWVLGTNGNLWLEQMPQAPLVYQLSTSTTNASVGVWPTGATIFTGTTTNGNVYTEDYAIGFEINNATGQMWTFATSGSLGSNWPNTSSTSFYLTGNNSELAQYFSSLQQYSHSDLAVEDSIDWGGVWNQLKTGVNAAQQVWNAIGPVIGAAFG